VRQFVLVNNLRRSFKFRFNIILAFVLTARSRELPLPLVFTTFVYSVLVSTRCTVVFYPFHPPKISPHKNVR
jgi:hypothetical protein